MKSTMNKGDSVIKCFVAIIGGVVFCFALAVTIFACLMSGFRFGKSLKFRWLRQKYCNHEWVKISSKTIRQEGKYIVKRTKWRCKKCGKEKYSEKP